MRGHPLRGSAKTTLRRLVAIAGSYGDDRVSAEKAALVTALARARLGRARDVHDLHEMLCFLRAYPDDAAVLAAVEGALAGFAARPDLRRFRRELGDSGIAGTTTSFSFFARPALRLAERWGRYLSIDWRAFDGAPRLAGLLPQLTLYAERSAFDEPALEPRAWIERFKGEGETDAAFLVRGWHALDAAESVRSAHYDDLDPPLRLAPGPDTPCRTREKHAGLPVFWQRGALARSRPDLAEAVRRRPISVRVCEGAEARALIELARDTMVPRERDLEVFAYANPADVRLIDTGDGLVFACIGVSPERRSLLEAVYAFLMLKNGVAVGYSLCTVLFGSSEIAYNVFETFRGGETALVFARLLSVVRHTFGSRSFAIDPYQLGHGNKEGLASGAFWFYQKLGFRPHDGDALAVLERELATMQRKKGHRSNLATLKKLARAYVLWSLERPRTDVLGIVSVANVALRVSAMLAERFGRDRDRAARVCRAEATTRLGVRAADLRNWTAVERQAFDRWAPLVVALPGVESWSPAEKREAVRVVRLKGGTNEDGFIEGLERHRKLRAAVLRLAR